MKRLIYGVSVVALMLTASFSFVSCDDYVQDQFTEIKKDLADKGTTIESLQNNLDRVESEYKAAIAAEDAALKQLINDKDAALKQLINGQDAMLFDMIVGLAEGVADSLSYYYTSAQIDEILKAYVTREELKDSLESVQKVMEQIAFFASDNRDSIEANTGRIKEVAANLLALTTRVEILEAAVKPNPDGSITLSPEMSTAVNKAVAAQIEAKAAEVSLAYKKYTDSISAKDREYTDEKYQAAVDSVKALAAKAEEVHAKVIEMVDSLHNAAINRIVALEGEVKNLEDEVADFREDYEAFALLCRECLNLLQNQIDDLNAQVDDLNAWRVGVNESIRQINEEIDKIKDTYKNQITSIVLQGTYNNVFGSINLPLDIQSMLLAGHYGTMAKSVSFPSSEVSSIYTGVPVTLDADDYVVESAGKAYLTINPSTVDINNVDFKLVNSLDEEIGFQVDTVVPSNDKLSFGWTRANNGFYEARISLNDKTSAGVESVKPRIDFEDIKYVIKKALTDKKEADLSSLARIVYENSSDILDAAAIKATWTDAFGVEQSVYTNYAVAATVMKPLSFEFDGFNQYAKKIANKLNEYTLKTFDPIAFEYEFDLDFDSIEIKPMPNGEFPIIILYKKGAMLKSIDGMAQMTAFIEAMNAYYVASTNNQINDLINDIEGQVKTNVQDMLNEANNKVNGYVNKVNNYINKFNTYFTKVVNKFGNADYNHYLQPVVLLNDEKGHFGQISRSNVFPTFVKKAGREGIILTPTTYTSELIAPAMLKYVAVTHVYEYNYDSRVFSPCTEESNYLNVANNTDHNMNVPFAGKQQAYLELPATEKLYEIYYEAVDFSGMTSSDKYYIYVVD